MENNGDLNLPPKFIVGCDIKGYSSLNSTEQVLITAHLAGCHTKSLGKARITPYAFNDAGDGFFVVFDGINDCTTYIKELCQFYCSECNAEIEKLAKSSWLKVACGEGVIYLTPQQGIRGDGINDVARILEVCNLPIPLQLIKPDKARDDEIYLRDKHGKKIFVKPCTFPWQLHVEHKPPCCEEPEQKNPFHLIKRPGLPAHYKELQDEGWWKAFNEYARVGKDFKKNHDFSRKAGEEQYWELYLSPIYAAGHTLTKIHERLETVARLGSWENAESSPEYPSEIKLIYLHPSSKHANELWTDRPSKESPLRDDILMSLCHVWKAIEPYPELQRRVHIAFTDKPVSIGIQKILDSMILIHYCDNHLSRNKTAFYRVLNFGSDEEEFKHYLDAYFTGGQDSLWGRARKSGCRGENFNYILKEIDGNEITGFLAELGLENPGGLAEAPKEC